ncbi:MAG: hypothetical protein AAF253_11940 [Pseudomonadota bacterium]
MTRRSLRATALGLATFLAIALLISAWHRSSAPRPPVAVMDEKLADYAQAAGTYDIVFLGSSQTFRHVDPAVVDAGLAQCGHPLRSYNFGIPALREPELRYMAEQIVEAPEKPALVVVQNPIRAETVFSNMMSGRGRYFRGGDHTGAALKDVQCYTGRRQGQARSLFNNLRVMLAEAFGLGRLAETFVPTDPPEPPTYNEAYRTNAGFYPVDQDGSDHIVDRLETSPMTAADLEQGRAGEGFVAPAGSATCRARQLTETLDLFQAAGVQVAYFVSPAPKDLAHDRPITAAMADLNPDLPILDFNTLDRADRYFDPALWYDAAHMNGAGAATLSADIAEALCTVMDE